MKRRHLVLAPHHDDAEFGMGGCIQKFLSDGDDVRVIVAARGNYTRSDWVKVLGSVRADESRAALTRLGVKDMVFEDWFVENGAMEAPFGSLVSDIEGAVREYEPTDVYVCLPSFNQDHRRLYEATLTVFRPGLQTASLYAYEYPGNLWAEPVPVFGRRYFIITADEMQGKFDALNMHKSQFEGRKVGVDPFAALKLATLRGAEIGEQYAEVLFVLREVVRP